MCIRDRDNTALLDIVGRDQPDQELTLEFNRERCVWEFQGAETELWKLPPDPLLEAVAKMLTPEQPEWSGTPTELLERLPGVSIQANILTRKLNVSADRLYNDYGIRYESRRTHEAVSYTHLDVYKRQGFPRQQPLPAAGLPRLPAVLRHPLRLGLGQLQEGS